MANIIFVDNDYYQTIADGGGSGPVTSWTVKVFIWQGDSVADKPAQETFSINVNAVFIGGFANARSGFFDLGSYVKPYLDFENKTGDYAKGVWVEYESTRDNFIGDTPINYPLTYALLGSNRYNIGTSQSLPVSSFDGKVFGAYSASLNIDPTNELIAPVYVGQDSTNATIVTDTQVITLTSLGATLNSMESDEQVFYVPLNASTFGAEWTEGNKINWYVADASAQPFLTGLEFNGVDSYLNLGQVPLLNSADSYVQLTFKASNYGSGSPNHAWGYDNSLATGDIFQLQKFPLFEEYFLQQTFKTEVNPSEYTNPNSYQPIRIYPIFYDPVSPLLNVEIDGVVVPEMEEQDYINRSQSGIDFYIGARNLSGVPDGFTELIFTEGEFFNGVDYKIFNAANNWGGATNVGGVTVYSTDGGQTWSQTIPDLTQYCINLKCYKGEDMIGLRYYNQSGALVDLPINGRFNNGTNVERTKYRNFILDGSGSWNPKLHGDKVYLANARNTYTMHTGWVNESTNQMISELLLSKAVWILINGFEFPINITDKQKQFINRVWQKEIGYQIIAEEANERNV